MKIKTDNYEIYKGDCLELMKNIPDKSIDMILCDLPYGTTECKWDKFIDNKSMWEHYNRILKENRIVIYNFSYSIENPSMPYKLVCEIENNTD